MQGIQETTWKGAKNNISLNLLYTFLETQL